jgi:uncharacterized protein
MLLLVATGLIVVINVLNNRIAPRAYLVVSVLGAGALLVVFGRTGLPFADAGLAAAAVGRGAIWGLAGLALVAAGHLVAVLVPATRRAYVDRRFDGASGRQAAYQILVRIPFGTVLLEEIAFRGVVYGIVDATHGAVEATVVSSVLFGLWHVLPSLELIRLNPLADRAFRGRAAWAVAGAVFASALAGALLCELRRLSASLIAPAAVHWAVNGLGYLTGFLIARRARRRLDP